MNRSPRLLVVVSVLFAIGFGVFGYKVTTLDFPLSPKANAYYWDLEAKVEFEGRGGPARVKFARAQDTEHIAVIDETYLKPAGFGIRRTRIGTDRFATLERRKLDARAIAFYRAVLVELDSSAPRPDAPVPVAESDYSAEARRAIAREEQTPFIFALSTIISDARARSVDRAGFIDEIIQRLLNEGDEQVRALRAGGPRGVQEAARRLAIVLNAADVPARRVEGLILGESGRNVPIARWVEIWREGAWRPYDPVTGEEHKPARLVPMSRGDRPLVNYSGVRDLYVSFAVERRPENAMVDAIRRSDERAPLISALSMTSLPVHIQDVFEVLLLVPVGALVIAFLRQVVGVQSFGTFMPVLIALSFRETSLLTGVLLFTGIVLIGLSLRAYFNRLQLLVVPRLAAVLSVVTLLMAAVAHVGAAFNLTLGLSIALFPLVILTMTIERMSLVWDEYGGRQALTQGAGSLFSAIVGYLVISNTYVEHLVFTFPELLLVGIGVMIALGRYNGYKLSEYWRFRSLAREGMDERRPGGGASA